jgi:hypothetical protein
VYGKSSSSWIGLTSWKEPVKIKISTNDRGLYYIMIESHVIGKKKGNDEIRRESEYWGEKNRKKN